MITCPSFRTDAPYLYCRIDFISQSGLHTAHSTGCFFFTPNLANLSTLNMLCLKLSVFYLLINSMSECCESCLNSTCMYTSLREKLTSWTSLVYTNILEAYKTSPSQLLGLSSHMSVFPTPAYKLRVCKAELSVKTVQVRTVSVPQPLAVSGH